MKNSLNEKRKKPIANATMFITFMGIVSLLSDMTHEGASGISGLGYIMSSSRTLYIDNKELEGDLVIPDGVTSIGSSAFEGCTGLTSITIPDSVERIGNNAFYGCTVLTIYCEVASQPSGWSRDWNPQRRPIVWGVTESTPFSFRTA